MKRCFKSIFLFFILCSLTVFISVGCSTKQKPQEDNDSNVTITTENDGEKQVENQNEKEITPPLEEDVDNITSYIGKSESQINELLGEPVEKSDVDVSNQFFSQYSDDLVLVFGYIDNEPKVFGFMYGGSDSLYGVKKGTLTKDVISILGMPDYDSLNEDINEYTMQYNDLDGNYVEIISTEGKKGKIDWIASKSNELEAKILSQVEIYEEEEADYIVETANGLKLKEYHDEYDDGFTYITGIIENPTYEEIDSVEIVFDLFDIDGNKVGTATDYIGEIGSGQTWKFEADVFNDDAATYELNEISSW